MNVALTAETRKAVGNQAQTIRNAGRIPAVVYGHGVEPRSISLAMSEFQKVLRKAGSSTLIDLVVDGAAPAKVLVQEVQVHHLTMRPNHVDLRQIRMDEELTVKVPLVFDGEAPAVKEAAGTLVHAYDELTVTCLPADLPHEIHVDLSSLKTFDDTITVASLVLPTGVKIAESGTTTIATVTPPMTDEQLKKLEEQSQVDVTTVKTEAEVKKAEAEAEEKEKAAADDAAKA